MHRYCGALVGLPISMGGSNPLPLTTSSAYFRFRHALNFLAAYVALTQQPIGTGGFPWSFCLSVRQSVCLSVGNDGVF